MAGGYGGGSAATSALDLSYGAAVALTIASGSVTRTGTSHTLTSESGSSDNLDLIAGGSDGDVIVIRPTIGHNITVRHNQNAGNTNNILLAADTAFLMDEDDNSLRLRYDAAFDTNGAWIEAGRDEPPAAAHTVASHSDTTATGAEIETLTDGSTTALHAHASSANLPTIHEDIRDTTVELVRHDFATIQTHNGIADGDHQGGFEFKLDGSGGAVNPADLTGGGMKLRTDATADSQASIITDLCVESAKNPVFYTKLASSAGGGGLKAAAWGFLHSTSCSAWTGTGHKACFRQATTGEVFAVTGNGSTEETTDLSGSVTKGTEYAFRLETTDGGTNWKFYVDGTLRATHNTTVPGTTTGMLVAIGIENNTTSDFSLQNIDYVLARQTRD